MPITTIIEQCCGNPICPADVPCDCCGGCCYGHGVPGHGQGPHGPWDTLTLRMEFKGMSVKEGTFTCTPTCSIECHPWETEGDYYYLYKTTCQGQDGEVPCALFVPLFMKPPTCEDGPALYTLPDTVFKICVSPYRWEGSYTTQCQAAYTPNPLGTCVFFQWCEHLPQCGTHPGCIEKGFCTCQAACSPDFPGCPDVDEFSWDCSSFERKCTTYLGDHDGGDCYCILEFPDIIVKTIVVHHLSGCPTGCDPCPP